MDLSELSNFNEGLSSASLAYQILLYRAQLSYENQNALRKAKTKLALTEALIADDLSGKQLCRKRKLLAVHITPTKLCQEAACELLQYSKEIQRKMTTSFDKSKYNQLMEDEALGLRDEFDIEAKVKELRKEEARHRAWLLARMEQGRSERKLVSFSNRFYEEMLKIL